MPSTSKKPLKPFAVTAVDLHTTGEHAIKDPKPRKDGAVQLRPWQGVAFALLESVLRRILIAPTGSGKSTAVRALALRDMEHGRKALVSYPQVTIAPGFGSGLFMLPGETVPRRWAPLPAEGVSIVEGVIRFLLSPPTADLNGRAFLCTHMALVRAVAKLKRMGKLKQAFENVSLFIDESHHSDAEDAAEETKEEEDLTNRLGELVTHYVNESPGPLTLVTATWLRTTGRIVPGGRMSSFTRFELPIDDYLESLEHLRNVRIRFCIGPQVETLRSLVERDPKRKTIVWLPLGHNPVLKMQLLKQCKKAVARLKLKQGDLVTDDAGRNDRRDALMAAIAARKGTPDLLWALNMFREGADWPEVSRGILLAPRGSVLDTIQMLGRLLRDWPGKDTAEFIIVLPSELNGEDNPEKIRDYLKIVLASMVVEWQFRRIDLLGSRKGTPLPLESVVKIIGGIVDESIEREGAVGEWNESFGLLLDAVASENPELLDPSFKAKLHAHASFFLKQSVRRILREAKEIPFDPKLQEETPFDAVRALAASFGFEDLRAFRLALGVQRQWSLPYITEKVLEFHGAHSG
jgi:hypothetical protein